MSPIVANIYMEEGENNRGTTSSHWFKYVDETWVKIQTKEVEAFIKHINSVDSDINFTRGRRKEKAVMFGLWSTYQGGWKSQC